MTKIHKMVSLYLKFIFISFILNNNQTECILCVCRAISVFVVAHFWNLIQIMRLF